MRMLRNPLLHWAAPAVVALTVAITSSAAQDWPTRPVTMVVPTAAGGALDVMGRILAPRMSEVLAQPVVVENVAGAGGMTGVARVAKAAPDGYQFALGTAGTHAQSQWVYRNPLYNAVTDFAPVGLIAEMPVVLVARKDLPASDLKEFISYAKTNQIKMQYGSPGVGSGPHLACVMLNGAAGISITHVPYRGGVQAMQDLIVGRIDYICTLASNAIPQMQGGTVKAIAILSRDRSPILPDLGSAHEQGLINFEAGDWLAIFLPKDASTPIVQKLNKAVVAAIETPSVQTRLKEIGSTIVGPNRRSPDYLASFVGSEVQRWKAPIMASGVSID